MSTTISQSFVKIGSKTKKIINKTFFVNKQLMLDFNFLKNHVLNFAQNFRKCLFNSDDPKSGEKSRYAQIFYKISQHFVYKIHFWT